MGKKWLHYFKNYHKWKGFDSKLENIGCVVILCVYGRKLS